MNKKLFGFSLVELLVVISVIGILAAVLLPNLLGVRERARDTARKGNLTQLRNALRLFYNDYQYYPEESTSNGIQGCGAYTSPEDSACTTNFATSGTNGVTYMKEIPEDFNYTQTASGDDYILYVLLENVSDSDITNSVSKCAIDTPIDNAYYVCE